MDLGEPVAQLLELSAGLEAGSVDQVGCSVTLHMH